MSPTPRRSLLRRAAVAAATLVSGGLAAFVLSIGGPVGASTADDITSHTSTTPDAYTSTTPEPYTSTTPDVSTSTTVDPYQAAQIAFYKATIIKPLPPAPPIRRLPASGWGIHAPAVCNALCVYAGTILAYNVGVWYSEASLARARTTTLGRVKVTGTGTLNPKITIRRAFRRKLLRAHRPVRLTVAETITDAQYGFVKRKTQTITLRPR